jgi:hypothetical protein
METFQDTDILKQNQPLHIHLYHHLKPVKSKYIMKSKYVDHYVLTKDIHVYSGQPRPFHYAIKRQMPKEPQASKSPLKLRNPLKSVFIAKDLAEA